MNRLSRILSAVLIAAPVASVAQDGDLGAGQREYMIACAGCHGESAKGDGPLAGLLEITTPDLTQITARAEADAFPFGMTLGVIDGRNEVRAHGGPMPIWGERYVARAREPREPYDVNPEAAELVARGRLMSLVLYLESIQE